MSQRLAHALFLVCATFCVWGTSLWNGFVWDDRILIQKNETNLSQLSLATAFTSDFWSTETEEGTSNYYRPLVTLSYMLDYALFRLKAAGYHATNLIIHAAGVLALWQLLLLLEVSLGMATIGALVWAVHPAVGESVAWVSGRTDSLATVFILLSTVATLKAFAGKKKEPRLVYVSAALFGAGLLCKESAFVTPLLIALFLTFLGKRHKVDKADMWCFGAVAVLWLGLRWSVLARPIGVESEEGASLEIGLLSLVHVWGNLVWPPVFRIEYGSSLTSPALLGGAACGALFLAWIALTLAAKLGPRQTRYLYLAGLIAFIPSVMAVLLKSMIGSRLIYTAAAFVIPAFVIGLRVESRSVLWKRAFGCVVLALSIFSIYRAQLWRSDVRLFSVALESADASTRNHLNLGIALYDTGDLNNALIHLSQDMERAALDQKFYMLALLYTGLGCEGLAEEYLRKSLEANPNFYSARHNLAGLLATQGRYEEARETLLKIAQSDKSVSARALNQVEALRSFSNIPRRDPRNAPWCSDPKSLQELLASPVGLNRLAGEQLRLGQVELADPMIQAVLRLDPWFVPGRLNLAQLYMLKRDTAQARATLDSILNTNPGEERARRLLAGIEMMEARGPMREIPMASTGQLPSTTPPVEATSRPQ